MKKFRCKHCKEIVFEHEKESHRKYCVVKLKKDPVGFIRNLFQMDKK